MSAEEFAPCAFSGPGSAVVRGFAGGLALTGRTNEGRASLVPLWLLLGLPCTPAAAYWIYGMHGVSAGSRGGKEPRALHYHNAEAYVGGGWE